MNPDENNTMNGSPVSFVPEGMNMRAETPSAININVEKTNEEPGAPVQSDIPWAERIAQAREAQRQQMESQAVVLTPEAEQIPIIEEEPVEVDKDSGDDNHDVSPLDNVLAEAMVDQGIEEISEINDDQEEVEEDPLPTPAAAEDDVEYPTIKDEDPIMDVPLGNLVEDVPRLSSIYNPSGDPEVARERIEKDPNDFYVSMMQLFSQIGTSVDLTRDYLEKQFAAGHKLTVAPDALKDSITRTTVKKESGPVQKLTGKDAKLAVLARAKGLRKVHLLNSGFWVTVRPPRIAELSQWYNDVSMESKDFGKMLGGHIFMFSDVLLRKKFMEIFPSLVVDSNLENWRAPDRLSKMISIQDYDTIVWACCTLVYKEAINVNLHCTNENCQYVAYNYKIDIDKLRLNNMDIIPEEALSYLSKQLVSMDKVSTAQVKQYHKLLGFGKEIKFGDVTYKLHVPSIYKFVECGAEFIKLILENIQNVDGSIDNEIEREVRVNVAKTYLPWVSRIATDDFETDDPEAIAAQLEMDLTTDQDLANRMLLYQFDTKISHYCYSMLECPKCHKTPSGTLTDYYPLDPTYLFFFLFSRQLSLMMY